MENMEIYWTIAARLFGILKIVVSGLLYGRFITPFLCREASQTGKIVRTTQIIYIGTMSVLYCFPYSMHGILAYLLGGLLFFFSIYFQDRRNVEQKIFLVFFLYLSEWMTYGIALTLRELLFKYIMFSEFAMELNPWVYFGLYLLVDGCYLLCRYFVMRFLLDTVDRIYLYKNENMSKKELCLMLAIPLSAVVGYFSFVFFSDMYLADTNGYIQDSHSSYVWMVALYQTISYAALVAVLIFYQDMKKNHRKEKENAVLAGQLENLKKHIGEVEALYRDIRGMRHDMGNHIMILENLCQKDRQEEAIGYLEKLKEQFHETEMEIKSGNPVTDILLTESKKEAGRRGISFQSDFYYPEGVAVNAFDVSIILNNALNNAIEGAAACDQPFIHLSSYREKNAYMIEIVNSLDEQVAIEAESGLPETTKENNGEHGYGLNNIRKVAQKYFGDIAIEQRDGMFLLHVMLMLEPLYPF